LVSIIPSQGRPPQEGSAQYDKLLLGTISVAMLIRSQPPSERYAIGIAGRTLIMRAARTYCRRCRFVLPALMLLAALPTRAAESSSPNLHFRVFVRTGLPLSGVLWTGTQFVYSTEGRDKLYADDASGKGPRVFAKVPLNKGEMRCTLSPGVHGFAPNAIYCHGSQGQIYDISADGHTVKQFAVIPTPHGSDGALTYDSTGAFGYTLLAATGGSDAGPGAVYAIRSDGLSRRVGSYSGPGGAENMAIAPRGLGAVAGQALITVDKHDHLGRLLAMDAHGHVTTLVKGLTWGLDPLAAIPAGQDSGSGALYLADWLTHNVLVAPAAPLRPFAGDLLVGTERHNQLYVLERQGTAYRLLRIRTNLHMPDSNYEGVEFGPSS
jgi:hypothetical protein